MDLCFNSYLGSKGSVHVMCGCVLYSALQNTVSGYQNLFFFSSLFADLQLFRDHFYSFLVNISDILVWYAIDGSCRPDLLLLICLCNHCMWCLEVVTVIFGLIFTYCIVYLHVFFHVSCLNNTIFIFTILK